MSDSTSAASPPLSCPSAAHMQSPVTLLCAVTAIHTHTQTINTTHITTVSRLFNKYTDNQQGDHSPDNVKFPDGSRHSAAAHGMLGVTHIMPILVLLSMVGVGMQQCMIRNHIFNI